MQDDWITKLHNRDYSFGMRPFCLCHHQYCARIKYACKSLDWLRSLFRASPKCWGIQILLIMTWRRVLLWVDWDGRADLVPVLDCLEFVLEQVTPHPRRTAQQLVQTPCMVRMPLVQVTLMLQKLTAFFGLLGHVLYIKNYSKPGNPANLNDAIWVHVSPVSYYHILFIILFRGISPYQAVKSQFGSVLDSMPLGK